MQRRTRRELLGMTASGMLAGGLWPGALRAAENGRGEAFHFIQVNDLHYLDERCGPWFEGVIRQMKAHPQKIDFCLVCGDLVELGKPAQHGTMRDLLKTLGMPFYTVVGNHDYTEGEMSRKPYDDAHPGRINYHFQHRGWQFLALDTSEGTHYKDTRVQPHTLRFLDETLPKLDKARPTVVFTHFPLGELTPMRPQNMDAVLERLKPYNVQAGFSGHFHGFTERHTGAATLTTDRCCSFSRDNHDGTKEKGYFLCEARDGKITRTFVEVPAGKQQ